MEFAANKINVVHYNIIVCINVIRGVYSVLKIDTVLIFCIFVILFAELRCKNQAF